MRLLLGYCIEWIPYLAEILARCAIVRRALATAAARIRAAQGQGERQDCKEYDNYRNLATVIVEGTFSYTSVTFCDVFLYCTTVTDPDPSANIIKSILCQLPYPDLCQHRQSSRARV